MKRRYKDNLGCDRRSACLLYAAILGIMVFLEGIGIIILFSTQSLFIESTTKFLSFLLRFFEGGSGFSTIIWSLIMQPNNGIRCCGMDSAQDFREFVQWNVVEVYLLKLAAVMQSRIENILRIEMRTFTLLCVGILLVQFVLFSLTAAALMVKLRLCRCE
ncbi:hypothetical protein ACTXT7_010594 [Hymenolepis weldensis]